MPSISRERAGQLASVLDGAASRGQPLRILFVHSDMEAVKHCLEALKRALFKVSSDVILTSKELSERLSSKFYDIVVAEYSSPNWKGMRASELIEKKIPLILLTDASSPETLAELVTQGAADCVEMDHIGHLPVAIRRALNEDTLRKERDETEKKLRHSEARYRALVGNLTYGMCRCSIEGRFLDVNQALVTMLGYSSRDELLGVNLATGIISDPGKRAQLLGHSDKNEDRVDPAEIDWKRKDGTILKIRLSGREVTREQGAIDGYEVIVENITKQRELEAHLRQEAAKDPLTGLANYRHLVDELDSEINRSKRTGRDFGLLLFDLDGLKQINDRYGHMEGGRALCRLADVLCICCRTLDTPARFGGDEFALVLPETGAESANLVAQRVCNRLAKDGSKPTLSVSVGVAIYPKDGEKIETLLCAADLALYSMKARVRAHGASDQRGARESRHKRTPVGRKVGAGRLSP